MDGCKKITGIIFAGIIAFAITACKVQPPGYVGLYVDNLISVDDTIDPGEAHMNMADTTMPHMMYTTFIIEAERPAGHQLFELRKHLAVISERSFTGQDMQEYQPLLSLPRKELATNQHDRDAPYKTVKDTILIVAFYDRGEIKPLEEASVLEQIKEWCSNINVTQITLSGYADSSGDEITNREITNKRLNYLSLMIIPYIAKEKIFFQNFGDIFASDTIVRRDRRIEIRLIIR